MRGIPKAICGHDRGRLPPMPETGRARTVNPGRTRQGNSQRPARGRATRAEETTALSPSRRRTPCAESRASRRSLTAIARNVRPETMVHWGKYHSWHARVRTTPRPEEAPASPFGATSETAATTRALPTLTIRKTKPPARACEGPRRTPWRRSCAARVLLRDERLHPQRLRRVSWPIRVAQHLASEQDQIGLARAQDVLRLNG